MAEETAVAEVQRVAKAKPAKERKPPHVKTIQGSQWVDDDGNIYELDESARGVFLLRLIKRAGG